MSVIEWIVHTLLEYAPGIIAFGVWIIWWLFLVDWEVTRQTLKQGGWVGLVLLGLLVVLVWGSLSPGRQEILPLPLPNHLEELTVVFGLVVIMLGCGALQLALWPPANADK